MSSPSNTLRLTDSELQRLSAEAQVQGDHKAARLFLGEAARRYPSQPAILLALLKSLIHLRDRAAVIQLTRSIQLLATGQPALLDQLGDDLQKLYEFDLALETFALLQGFSHPQIQAVGKAREAALHLRVGRHNEAEKALLRARQLGPDLPEVLSVTALFHRKDDPLLAKAILEKLSIPSPTVPIDFTAASAHSLAAVCDSLGLADEAMKALDHGKSLEAASPLVQRFRAQREAWRQWHRDAFSFTPEEARKWAGVQEEAPRHALLLGHPRSGTTLLEQLLDAHPNICSVEESDIYATTIDSALIRRHASEGAGKAFGPWLHELPLSDLRVQRDTYFTGLERDAGRSLAGMTVLDKNPAMTICVGRLPRTLPAARLIVMLRDPRDVCLSAYFQSTHRTPWSVNWLSLRETVEQYVFAMDLWLQARPKLAQPWIEVRYEDVVHDPEREGSRVTRFLGLEWNDAQADPAAHARSKVVRSPTHADVVQPVHPHAIGRWQRYRKHLEPFFPLLDRFVGEFGYEKA